MIPWICMYVILVAKIPWICTYVIFGSKNTFVATYPSTGGRRGAHGCVFQERKMRGVATNVYLRKTSEKPERCGLRTLSVKGSGVVFTHGEGISTPRVRHKGQQPLIECANMTSNCFIFLFFYVFMSFYAFLFFYLFVVDKVVSLALTYSSIAIRKSDLRSSLRIERWLSCFYLFCKIYFDRTKVV